MSTFIVNTLTDTIDASDGKLSLREAVTQANATAAADTILFAAGLEGKTLVLTSGSLILSRDTVIDGDQNNDGTRITLSGNDSSRIFEITGLTKIFDIHRSEAEALEALKSREA